MLMFTILSNSSYAYMISNEPKKIVQMKLEAKMKVLVSMYIDFNISSLNFRNCQATQLPNKTIISGCNSKK